VSAIVGFTHLHVHSHFSFMDGVPSVPRLVARAAELGMGALALTDHNNVSGALRFHREAQKVGLRPIQGAEVTVNSVLAPDREAALARAPAARLPGRPSAPELHVTLLAKSAKGYASLCRILTDAHGGSAGPSIADPEIAFQPISLSDRWSPVAPWQSLEENAEELFCLSGCRRGEVASLLLRERYREAEQVARRYRDVFGAESYFLELQNSWLPRTRRLNELLAELAEHLGVGIVATNDVHYLDPEDFEVHDLLTCARTLTRLEDVHPDRPLNGHQWLKPPREMAPLFAAYPKALVATTLIAEQCGRAIDLKARHFPTFPGLKEGESAFGRLCELVFEGARGLAPDSGGRDQRLRHELEIIHRLGFAEYFLVVWDVARYAREKGIRYAGRGSAADSMVAYCLGITQVNSYERGLLFERFMSLERAQKPDIDIDFDARYRDDVARYLYETYGTDRVATVCTYNSFRARSSLRDLGKAMGFPEPEMDRLAKRCPHFVHAADLTTALESVPELRDSGIPFQRFRKLFELVAKVDGSPRFLSTHLGGVVISRDPLTHVSPLQRAAKGVTVVQFDKDDIEDLGLIKLDLLCLRMLSAVEDTLHTLRETGTPVVASGEENPAQALPAPLPARDDYDRIPMDDAATFELLRTGETIGAFQLESPAQRMLQSRLGADKLEDLIASVALIRPGPIAGNMVAPFVARRRGEEPVTYLHPKLEPILRKTFGVVLYQEQVIEIATAIAGFTPGESDRLRKVMTHARNRRDMEGIGEEFIRKAMQEQGCTQEVAETIFSYIVGYAGYGFCEAHAAAFGLTAYRTSYLLRHHPAPFYAAILSNQPMGYYPSNTICLEARRRGITLLPPDVNFSGRCFTVERDEESPAAFAIRVSLSQVRGIARESVDTILGARMGRDFSSLMDFCRRTRAPRDTVENLILCGAFDRLPMVTPAESVACALPCGWDGESSNRRQLFWAVAQVLQLARRDEGPLFRDAGEPVTEAQAAPPVPMPASYHLLSNLEDFTDFEKFQQECEVLGINVSCHVMSYYRERLRRAGVMSSADLAKARTGEVVTVAGVVLRPHRPPTKSGRTVVFMALEDELGSSEVTVFEDVYLKYGSLIFGRPALIVRGVVDRRGGGKVSVTAERIRDLPITYRSDNLGTDPESAPEAITIAPSDPEEALLHATAVASQPSPLAVLDAIDLMPDPLDEEEELATFEDDLDDELSPRRHLLDQRFGHLLGSRAAQAYGKQTRG
jgi:error-prone DNA polymerase